MATVTIGSLVVDLDGLSKKSVDSLIQLAETGLLDDTAIAALAENARVHPSANGGKDGDESKASKIRRMAAAGMSRGDIAKALDVRFQFVYNVLRKDATNA
jgi:hypothetical protein